MVHTAIGAAPMTQPPATGQTKLWWTGPNVLFAVRANRPGAQPEQEIAEGREGEHAQPFAPAQAQFGNLKQRGQRPEDERIADKDQPEPGAFAVLELGSAGVGTN